MDERRIRSLLEPTTAEQCEKMAKFRDLLVHGYARIDDRRVVDILRTRLGDLDDFRREIARGVAG